MQMSAAEAKELLTRFVDEPVRVVFVSRSLMIRFAMTGKLVGIPPDTVGVRTGSLPTDNFAMFRVSDCFFEYGEPRELPEADRGTLSKYSSVLTVFFPPRLDDWRLMERIYLFELNAN